MARILINIHLRTGSCPLASTPCPNHVPARIPPAVNRPRQQIMQQIADRSCRNKRIDRRPADKLRHVDD